MSDATGRQMQGRVEWFRPEDLDGEGRALYDAITGGPRKSELGPNGELTGPFNAMLLTPTVGNALQNLGAAIRFGSGLENRAREIATLEAARGARSDYEWLAHAALGRSAGLTDDEIAGILEGRREISSLSPHEAAVREVCLELLEHRGLDDEHFERAVSVIGRTTLMEVLVLVGYYNLLAMSMHVWQVPLHEGMSPVFRA